MVDVVIALIVVCVFVTLIKEATFIKATFTEMVKGMRNV